MSVIPTPKMQFFDDNGAPLAGGLLYSYLAGTSTPSPVYSDVDLLVPLSNPVILDAAGRAQIYVGDRSYKFVLKTALGATIWTADNIRGEPTLAVSGNWTPVIGGSGGTSGQSYTTQLGRYIKTGPFVVASFNAVLSAKGTITGNVQIQGLPFACEYLAGQSVHPLTISYWNGLATAVVSLGGFVVGGATAAYLAGVTAAATGSSLFAAADISNTTQLVGVALYRTDS